MYPEEREKRLAEAQMAGYALGQRCEVKQPGVIQDAINRANGVANLLENTNGLLDNSLSRLTGGVPVPERGGTSGPQGSGDIGLLMATLDRVYALANLNSDYAGQVARL